MELGLAQGELQNPGGVRRTVVKNLTAGTTPSQLRLIHKTQRQPGEYHRSQSKDSQKPMGSVPCGSASGLGDHNFARVFALSVLRKRTVVGTRLCRFLG